ncbi:MULTISPECIES: MoxR family ATPase [Streptomyces]|uniref:AAA family ATPase n=1 Tax=Streptomyces venezuelae TaxID=54571 RepID=A0A5P2BK07_STRVZ|nr:MULTISPECIES: MoxR family ATPase [Streptomyces]NEA05209.1 AAA domain-containing protein [Streptomyces sp. SID10116]MYY83746.1 AAA domain-containing protein [Streptomyces sp. SID335]MYZ13775.1 AAA domain-containing protein [Streptomyces sp. SID337]NDZ86141.1 AAA domain-containing protein [Streptomyces sp. SID10115]NEB49045.1 AAA domain-containing protein [Streptomyces sp. SID339]
MTTPEPPAATSPRSSSSEGGGDDWWLFRGDGESREVPFPAAPPWRRFDGQETATGDRVPYPRPYLIGPDEVEVVNAALHLRRPLLVTGQPGTGKSSMAHAIAHELTLGRVLQWPVNSRSTLQDALYHYDAVGRLREATLRRDADGAEPDIGQYIRLGPLGNALVPRKRPRVLLVDELDKGDVDLPNDLLTVFEEGEFAISELTRLPAGHGPVQVLTDDPDETAPVTRGRVRCDEFPVVVITSNGEREFPPAFLRRCIRLDLPEPDEQRLREIVTAHLGPDALADTDDLLREFLERRAEGDLATDQLLNAVFLRKGGVHLDAASLLRGVLHRLGGTV